MEHYYALILAGGGGTRLWPMSRGDKPKQLLALVEDRSMFGVSVDRLSPLFMPKQIYVVCGQQHVEDLQADAPSIPPANFVVEPYGRDNAAAVLLALSVIRKRDPQATVAILTSDHHITDKARFRSVLETAWHVAQRGSIVTLGITPNVPATGYGYIRRGEHYLTHNGFEVFHSRGFTEKPDFERAVQFLQSGDYSWNSGMFIWTVERALNEFRIQQPEMYALSERLQAVIDTPDYEAVLAEVWEQMKRISIDFAVMEHADDLAVIPVDIGWSDVGSWASLYEVLEHDASGNSLRGNPDHVLVDTTNSLIYSDKLTVAVGVENLVIVNTDDVLMICHGDRTQDIRDVVNLLRDSGREEYL